MKNIYYYKNMCEFEEINYLAGNGFLKELSKKITKENCNGYKTNYGYFTPLSAAIASYDLEVIKFLIDYGVDLNKKFYTSDYGGINTYPIHYSVIQEAYLFYNNFHSEMIIPITNLLFSNNANINLIDDSGYTCLEIAINFKNNTAYKYLREKGAKTSEELEKLNK